MVRWLRIVWVLLLTVAVDVSGTTVFELLCEFRRQMCHRPGVSVFHSTGDVLRQGGGSSAELANAFQSLLLARGFESRLVSGVVSMDSMQLSEWVGCPGRLPCLGARLGSDGRWLVPMQWVRCRGGYGVELCGGEACGSRWLDVFPGLLRGESMSGYYGRVLPGDSAMLAEGLCGLSSNEGRLVGSGAWCHDVTMSLLGVLGRRSAGEIGVSWCGWGGIRGYCSERVQSLRPVSVVFAEEVSGFPEVTLGIEVWSSDQCLLDEQVSVASLSGGLVELSWGEEVFAPVGSVVLGRRMSCGLSSGGEELHHGESEMVGRPVRVEFSFSLGEEVLGSFTDEAVVGEHVAYVLSRGGHRRRQAVGDSVRGRLCELACAYRERWDRFWGYASSLLGLSACPIGVSRVGLRPFGEYRLGDLYRVSGYEVVLECLGDADGRSGNLALILGSSYMGMEILSDAFGVTGESSLQGWYELVVKGADLMCSGEGLRRDGGALTWDASSQRYISDWCDSRGKSFRGGAVKAGWPEGPVCWRGHDGDEEVWCSMLDLWGQLQGAVREKPLEKGAREVLGIGIFCGAWYRRMQGVSLEELTVQQEQDEGKPLVRMKLTAERSETWQLNIVDEGGKTARSFTGKGLTALVEWDGCDEAGKPCPEGDYVAWITLRNGVAEESYERIFRWDPEAPRCRLYGTVKDEEDGTYLMAEYGIEDRYPARSQVRVLTLKGEEMHCSEWLDWERGSYRWKLEETEENACVLELRAWDSSGNAGTARQQVVLGQVFVGGTVWSPHSDDETDDGEVGIFGGTLETPVSGETCQELVLRVTGSLFSDTAGTLCYQLRMRDGMGKLLECREVSDDGEWRLHVGLSELPEQELELRQPQRRCEAFAGTLGALDVSDLPNGTYVLELVVLSGREFQQETCELYLEKRCEPGLLEFSEREETVSVKGIRLPLHRNYRSRDGAGELGHGWRLSLGHVKGQLREQRFEEENLAGERISVRAGGSRDVTLELPDGSRRTFRFSLEPGGGWSYAYYGRWKTGGGGWELRSTVSSDVVALPGLEPYWEAAGMGVPLDMYDFPGFVLRGKDGVEYVFSRKSLGSYESLAEDSMGAMVECWGDLTLSRVIQPDGSELVLDDDRVLHRERSGQEVLLLELARDESGRIRALRLRDGSQVELSYVYDAKGNLVQCWKRQGQAERCLKRSFEYDDARFPHLLTAIKNGSGRIMMSYAFDANGRLLSAGNGMGGQLVRACDVFAGTEVRTDENGFETVYQFDVQGNVLEKVKPDGGILSYAYDAAGNMVQRIDELGRETRWTYDAAGNMTSRRNPLGDVTRYGYDRKGDCVSMTDELTGTTTFESSGDGRQVRQVSERGEVSWSKDEQGRLVQARMSGMLNGAVTVAYDGTGTVTLADGMGEELEVEELEMPGGVRTVQRWVNTVTGEVEEHACEALRDREGRALHVADGEGNSVEYERNDAGQVLLERHGDGFWKRFSYDVGGRLTEEVWSTGWVRRQIYTSGGLLLVAAGPQRFSPQELESGEGLVFATGTLLEHDACGRIVRRSQCSAMGIASRDLGDGCVECVLEDVGHVEKVESTEYDLHGQVIRRIHGDGREERLGYDFGGHVAWQEDGDGNRSCYERDGAGRLTRQVDPLGGETRWAYDCHGHLLTRWDCDGRTLDYVRDVRGRVREKRVTGEVPVTFVHNDSGQVVGVRAGTLSYGLKLSARGQLLEMTDGKGQINGYVYDGLGRLIGERSRLGHETRWGYEGEGMHFRWMADGAGRRQHLERNRQGRIQRIRWEQGGDQWELDCAEADRTVERWGEEVVRTEEWKRDARDRRICLEVNGQQVLTYGYDAYDRVASCRTGETAFSCDYGNNGQLKSRQYLRGAGRTLPKPLIHTMATDGNGRVVREKLGGRWRILHYDSMGRIAQVSSGQGEDEDYVAAYTFDAGGRRCGMRERRGQDGRVRDYRWSYDELGQLTEEAWGPSGARELEYEWKGRYDCLGNLVDEWRSLQGKVFVIHHDYDADNRLISSVREGPDGRQVVEYAWDGSGRLTEERGTVGEPWRRVYLWDCRGMLAGVRLVTGEGTETEVFFGYGSDGVLCSMERRNLGQPVGGRVLFELRHEQLALGGVPKVLDWQVSDDGGRCVSASVIHGVSPLGIMVGERLSEVLYNGHGGPVRQDGQWCFYDGWGQRLGGQAPDGPGAFGEWQEAVSGLVYLRGRFYSPRLRRFISPDPVRGMVEEPRSLHRYAYCLSDPLNRVDPTGAFSVLSMLLSVSHCNRVFFAYTALTSATSAASDILGMVSMTGGIQSRSRKEDHGTLFVHGMNIHDRGWSEPMRSGLVQAGVSNQDFYEFRWSGFSFLFSDLLVPRWPSHFLATLSLTTCLNLMLQKGYEKVNVISHSWGTVLSRLALWCIGGLKHGVWVTMGSPLGMTPMPSGVGRWLNMFNTYDPVVFGAPVLVALGHEVVPIPLCLQHHKVSHFFHVHEINPLLWGILQGGGLECGIEQYLFLEPGKDAHSFYWTRPGILEEVGRALISQ